MSASNMVASSVGRISASESPSLMARVQKVLKQAWRKHRTRRMLTQMDDRMLSDLGISRAQASFEASRSMWD